MEIPCSLQVMPPQDVTSVGAKITEVKKRWFISNADFLSLIDMANVTKSAIYIC